MEIEMLTETETETETKMKTKTETKCYEELDGPRRDRKMQT